jgi:hypothetical protein
MGVPADQRGRTPGSLVVTRGTGSRRTSHRRADREEQAARATRLVELTSLLDDRPLVLHGLGAEWLFEDVKATWLYGYFTGTVLTAYAFCVQQVAGVLRMNSDDHEISDEAATLEILGVAEQRDLIDLDLRAQLVALHDSAAAYLTSGLSSSRRQLERRVEDTENFIDEHTLLADARSALGCCIGLLHG